MNAERMDDNGHGTWSAGERTSALVGRRWPTRRTGEALADYLDRIAAWADGWT